MLHVASSLTAICLCVLAPANDGEPVTAEQLRGAVERSLPPLEKEGVAWMEQKKCMSCHQVPSLLWSFNAAHSRGYRVDEAKLAKWNAWAFKSAFGGNSVYKLPESAWKALAAGGLSDDDANLLKPLAKREFIAEREFLEALGQQLPPEVLSQHRELILKSATKPGISPGGQDGPSAAYQVMFHTGTVAAIDAPERSRDMLFEALCRTQQKDGLWKTSSPFLAMNRPKPESHEVNTQWILLALSYQEPLPPALQAAQTRARQLLAKSQPGVSTESLLLHMLLADKAADGGRAAELQNQLLELQRPDGGWAWRKESADSDALTTGQVLYALSLLGRGISDPHVQRGCRYLLDRQQEDGSWNAPWLLFNVENNKDHTEGNKVFSYWATGWSAVGLLHTLPADRLASESAK